MGRATRVAGSIRDPYRELFERSADAILIIEGDTFIDCNDATVKMLRYTTREEVLQTHPSELSPPFQPDGRSSYEKANEMIAIAFARGSHRFEWDHRRADGEVFPVEVLLTAVQEANRRVLHVVWRDITERKMLEDQLRQALKMEAIGKLAGGIAHDFNNLLVAVLGHSDLLVRMLQDRPPALEHVAEIRRAGERAADLVRQLLAFGRKQQLLPAVVDLNRLTLDLRRLLDRLIGEDIELVTDLADDPIPIKVDRTQIEQVLLNLVANARDAMQRGGRLVIGTRRVRHEVEECDALSPGDYALLSVSDTGIGMDSDVAEHAFDPFFTTKPVGEGSGLGLATVFGIIQQSGGAVSLDSTPGSGTRVDILLPLTKDPLEAGDAEACVRHASAHETKRGGETLLIVEDEPSLSSLLVRALHAHGYDVLSAENGREALDLFRRHADDVALVVTDVIMPEMGGPQFIAELEALGHHPRVLFMSGYTNEHLSRRHEAHERVDMIDKPFGVRELLDRVRQALDR